MQDCSIYVSGDFAVRTLWLQEQAGIERRVAGVLSDLEVGTGQLGLCTEA